MYEQTTDAQNGSDASNNEHTDSDDEVAEYHMEQLRDYIRVNNDDEPETEVNPSELEADSDDEVAEYHMEQLRDYIRVNNDDEPETEDPHAEIDALASTYKQLASELRLLERGFDPDKYDNEFTRADVKCVRGKVAQHNDGELTVTADELTIMWTANADFRFNRGAGGDIDHERVAESLREADENAALSADGGTEQYRGMGDSTVEHRPEDDAVIMTDGGAAGCPHGHAYCEGADSPADKPELCFDCWDEWAAYEPEMLDESEQWDPETDPRPQVKADYDAGTDAGIVEDTCAIPHCSDEPIEGERMGLCPDHAADDAVDRGEDIMTDGGAESVAFTAPGNSIGSEVEPGTVIELPYNGGMWTVSAVKEPAVTRITEYHVEPVAGGEGQVWKEYELENAFDAGASIIGGGA